MSTLSSTCPSLSVYLRAWDDIPFFPADLISFPDGDSLLEKLYITELTVEGGETQTSFSFTLAWETGEEFSIELPGTSGISLVFGAGGATELKLAFVFAANAFELSIEGGVTLRFDNELIRPVDEESREVIEGSAYEVYLSGTITADAEGNIKIAGADSIAFAPFAIGDTGVIVEPGAVALCLSSETAALLAAEHTDAELSSTFRGVFIPAGSVVFPDDFPVESIAIENAFIGNGGFTGSVETTVETSGSILGFSFTLTSFTLSFIRNAISSCEGKGSLTIPFFDCEVDSTFSISSGGEMLVALDGGDADGIVSKPVGPIGTLSLTALEFMSASESAYIQLSGSLAFEIEGLEALDLPVVAIDGLRIGSDGQVSIAGGGLTLQQQQALNFYGFEMVLTSINLGREPDDDRNWIAFSGGIKLTEGLPAGVSTKGLRLLWQRGGTDVELECEGVSVAFEIPEVLSFAGAISLTGTEFRGDIELKLLKLDIAVDAALIIGETSDEASSFNYFKVEIDADLPLGIPLGATGVALYGFNGLFAHNMAPDTPAGDFDWYDDWYKASPEPQPWEARRGAVGLGAGTTLGTLADNGYAFATKVALVFSFPGPVVMLQGVGNMLRKRAEVENSPIFDSLVLFDGEAGNVLAHLDVQYSLPMEGDTRGRILDTDGSAEAFFDLSDADNWHIYLGEEDEEKRIRAQALQIFNADAYVMLDPESLRAGASIGYDAGFDFEVVSVKLAAWLAGSALVSFAPPQFSGELSFQGELDISCFGFGFAMSAEAGVAAQTPTPYSLEIDLKVAIDLPWPFDDVAVEVELKWEEAETPEPVSPVLHEAWVRAFNSTEAWSLPITTESNETNENDEVYRDGEGLENIVALDARPVLIFNRNVDDTTGVGSPAPDVAPETVGEGRHEYRFSYKLKGLKLERWDATAAVWTDDVGLELYGSWQATGDKAGTQLELYGDGPFSFCREVISLNSGSEEDTPAWTPYVDSFLVTRPGFPLSLSPVEVNFEPYTDGENLSSSFTHEGLAFQGATPSGAPQNVYVRDMTAYGGRKSLNLSSQELVLSINFPQPVSRLAVKLIALNVAGLKPPGSIKIEGIKKSGALVRAQYNLQDVPVDFALDPVAFSDIKTLKLVGANAYLLGLSYLLSSTIAEGERLVESSSNLLNVRFLLLQNSDYRITVETETEIVPPSGSTSSETETSYAFFKTYGPPQDVSPYIEKMIPAQGSIPHFAAYDLILHFNENYLEKFYGDGLSLRIFDNNGSEVGSSLYKLSWEPPCASPNDINKARIPYTTTAWLGALADSGLAVASEDDAPANNVLYGTLNETQTLPTAQQLEACLYHSDYDEPVLNFNFLTSRFESFSQLIASFLTKAWTVKLASGVPTEEQLLMLQNLALERAAAGPALSEKEGETFEDIYYNIFGLPAWTRPAVPEAIVLHSRYNLGLLLEFPEPVEWDRIDLTVTRSSAIKIGALRSSDQSRALLLIPNTPSATRPKAWTRGSYTFQFSYNLDTADASRSVLYYRGSNSQEKAGAFLLEIP